MSTQSLIEEAASDFKKKPGEILGFLLEKEAGGKLVYRRINPGDSLPENLQEYEFVVMVRWKPKNPLARDAPE